MSAITSVGAGSPNAATLIGSYPNPFSATGGSAFGGNPSTNITFEYSLPQPANVDLRIFDLLGREVRTLVSAQQAASVPTVTWDGKNASGVPLGSGVYFAQLTASPLNGRPAYRETVKLLLVK
jgi:flagellar hook assembly protein FlgD